MELKSICKMYLYQHLQVLIVPLWNWNSTEWEVEQLATVSSNCTFMELKCYHLAQAYGVAVRSNCTFMELKLILCINMHFKPACSNCTFMELKYKKKREKAQKISVLIVPLWNWNRKRLFRFCFHFSSNCTFMELKYVCFSVETRLYIVLIVPLWNWNIYKVRAHATL